MKFGKSYLIEFFINKKVWKKLNFGTHVPKFKIKYYGDDFMKKNDLKEQDFNEESIKEAFRIQREKKRLESSSGVINEGNIVDDDDLNITPEEIEKAINEGGDF